jgi:hypothetical protein
MPIVMHLNGLDRVIGRLPRTRIDPSNGSLPNLPVIRVVGPEAPIDTLATKSKKSSNVSIKNDNPYPSGEWFDGFRTVTSFGFFRTARMCVFLGTGPVCGRGAMIPKSESKTMLWWPSVMVVYRLKMSNHGFGVVLG